eukprot:TRINITY_DN31850_c0_g1_i1.p1 TRINITY_DN31850_c0_g1~~TRINITY_DN31850_c0_g1_i1.p1  ORF type:complete len:326 (+),score=-40.29 TRINITY_DN31850_c0_g1_i1:84-980(+)
MRFCKILGSSAGGVLYDGNSTGLMEDCSVSNCKMTGLEVRHGASVVFRRVTVEACGQGLLYWNGAGDTLLEDCSISQTEAEGVVAANSGVLRLVNCRISKSQTFGVSAAQLATVQMEATAVSESGICGVNIQNKSTVSLSKCEIHNNHGGVRIGINFSAITTITDCHIHHNVGFDDHDDSATAHVQKAFAEMAKHPERAGEFARACNFADDHPPFHPVPPVLTRNRFEANNEDRHPRRPNLQFCASCGKAPTETVTLRRCTGCFTVSYCDSACQAAHRKDHKNLCEKVRNDSFVAKRR